MSFFDWAMLVYCIGVAGIAAVFYWYRRKNFNWDEESQMYLATHDARSHKDIWLNASTWPLWALFYFCLGCFLLGAYLWDKITKPQVGVRSM